MKVLRRHVATLCNSESVKINGNGNGKDDNDNNNNNYIDDDNDANNDYNDNNDSNNNNSNNNDNNNNNNNQPTFYQLSSSLLLPIGRVFVKLLENWILLYDIFSYIIRMQTTLKVTF